MDEKTRIFVISFFWQLHLNNLKWKNPHVYGTITIKEGKSTTENKATVGELMKIFNAKNLKPGELPKRSQFTPYVCCIVDD